MDNTSKSKLSTLTLAAIGIVYGDIGTSPLYTMKEVFSMQHASRVDLTEANILGVVSLIVWGLILIVSLKYVVLVLRANNRGEGGVMALVALAMSSVGEKSRWYYGLMIAGLIGTALFFGDGVITPAISVLSAVEGLEVATPALKPYVVPLTVLILIVLYTMQHKGTARIGRWFGPIVLLWFIVLASMGMVNIIRNPTILAAMNPLYAATFLIQNSSIAFFALGAIVLAFTGAEALYADMGHFGKNPIRLAWFGVVFPALAINYLGQGALLLSDPLAASNPFYRQLGAWSIYPLVVLSTMATVIASQATISGTFSMTRQAISLGFLPRMRITHTSEEEQGQIYIPLINWLQLAAVVLAVIGFGSSSNLAAAYGIAVTGTMLMTTLMTFFVVRYGWGYNLLLCIVATGFFLTIDVALFSANISKITHGGWFPLALGAAAMVIFLTWRSGRALVYQNLQTHAVPLQDFFPSLFINTPVRVPGTAVFFRATGDGVPHAMLHNLLHNRVLHERNVFLTIRDEDIPYVPAADRIRIAQLEDQCYQVDVFYGFKDERNIPLALRQCQSQGLEFDMMLTSFFISRQNVVPGLGNGMAAWREALFALMSRNARDAADYYQIPPNRVIELGAQVEI